jgi:hypothetical protein
MMGGRICHRGGGCLLQGPNFGTETPPDLGKDKSIVRGHPKRVSDAVHACGLINTGDLLMVNGSAHKRDDDTCVV